MSDSIAGGIASGDQKIACPYVEVFVCLAPDPKFTLLACSVHILH